MQTRTTSLTERVPEAAEFYRHAMATLDAHRVPFLIGGAYALEWHTGINHRTTDLDIMVRPTDCRRALELLASVGYETELTFPHWLGKVFCGEDFIDLIFNAGNGIASVDDTWFERAVEGEVMGTRVQFCSAEDLVWSKSWVMERERFDGADVAHLLRSCAQILDWSHLLCRFGSYWRVLLSHLVLFGFIYPGERSHVPSWLMEVLTHRLQNELNDTQCSERVCQGTLLSREQYLVDIKAWEYADARLAPRGGMTRDQIAHWTAAIGHQPRTSVDI